MEPDADGITLVTLLRRAAQSDCDAQEELLVRLTPIVVRYLRQRVGRPPVPSDLLDELTQEALGRIALGMSSCLAREDRQLVAWSLQVAWHAAVDYWSSPRSGVQLLRRSEVLDEQVSDEGVSPQRTLYDPPRQRAQELLYRLAVEAQADLPLSLPPLLWYRLVRGESWEEIGRRFGTTPAGAKRRFQRAQGALRRAIARRRGTLTADQQLLLDQQLKRWGEDA